jgi:hypothetical protein
VAGDGAGVQGAEKVNPEAVGALWLCSQCLLLALDLTPSRK